MPALFGSRMTSTIGSDAPASGPVTQVSTLLATASARATIAPTTSTPGSGGGSTTPATGDTLRVAVPINDGQSATTSNILVPVPTQAVAGDVMIVTLDSPVSTGSFTDPTGWTLLSNDRITSTPNTTWIYGKQLVSADLGTTVFFTYSSAIRCVGAVGVFKGVMLDGFTIAVDTDSGASTTTPNLPTLTDVPAGSTVVAIAGRRASFATAPTITIGDGWTQVATAKTGYNASPEAASALAYKSGVTAGTYGGELGTSNPATFGHTYVLSLPGVPVVVQSSMITAGASAGAAVAGRRTLLNLPVSTASATAVIAAVRTTSQTLTARANGAATSARLAPTTSGILLASATGNAVAASSTAKVSALTASAVDTAAVVTGSRTAFAGLSASVSASAAVSATRTQAAQLISSAAATAGSQGIRERLSTLAATAGAGATVTSFVAGVLAATAVGSAGVAGQGTTFQLLDADADATASIGGIATHAAALLGAVQARATIAGFKTIPRGLVATAVGRGTVAGFVVARGFLVATAEAEMILLGKAIAIRHDHLAAYAELLTGEAFAELIHSGESFADLTYY